MSLRLKLILALMLTSLVSVALVGGTAYLQLQRKFESLPAQHASEHFQRRVADYIARYGSLQPGPDGQDFREFMQQRPGRGVDAPPPRPREDGAGDRRPPPPGEHRPPFRFILTDGDYIVILGAGIYHDGDALPPEARKDLRPVTVEGTVRAYVSTEGVLSPGPDDLAYLDTMRQALLWGVGVAAALALILGALLGEGLSARLRRLTAAVQAMRAGDLRQRMGMTGQDEVAQLAQAFDAMSEQLASSHESLEASHATILAQSEQLKELSIRDALTGLYNRRHFDEGVQQLYRQATRYGRPLSVVVADIDWFKKINDRFSHAIGDAVLRQVSEILAANLRASDLLARWGGEEFVIALPETSKAAAAALCDKLRAAIAHFPWGEITPELQVTMSFGVSAEMSVGSPQAMLDGADTQLYRAKEGGRNQVCMA